MEEEYFDITETGEQGYRQLQRQNNNVFDNGYISLAKPSKSSKTQGSKQKSSSSDNLWRIYSPMMPEKDRELFEEYYSNNPWDFYENDPRKGIIDYAQQTGDRSYREIGKSPSRLDNKIYDESDWIDIEDTRGIMQSGFNQIMSGLGKMAVIAGTTAVDNFVGTAAGIMNMASQAIQGNINNFDDLADAFVYNPTSKWLIDLQKKADEWMPVYTTREEQETPWYQKLWRASFIGDNIMKNTGFFVGTALSAYASSGLLSKAFKVNQARNIFKDTAMAAGLGETSPKEVLSALKSGERIAKTEQVIKSLEQAATNARNADLKLKLFSSAMASFGESRMEAISNSDAQFEKDKNILDGLTSKQIQDIDAYLADNNPELFSFQKVYGPEGNVIGMNRVPVDYEAYRNAYNERRQQIDDKYNNALEELTRQRIKYSNSSFAINFALTFGENLFLFSDAAAGSWSKRAGENRTVYNSALKQGAADTGELSGRAARKATKAAAIADKFTQKQGIKAADIGKGLLKGPGFEMEQEMFQEATTTYLNRRSAYRLNTYYGDIIDPDGLQATSSGFYDFVKAVADTHTDPEKWESGFIGFLTAMLPLPTRVMTQNTQEAQRDSEGNVKPGQKKPQYTTRWTVGGEFWETVREAKDKYNETEASLKALNDIGNDKQRKERVLNIIKQNNLRQEQQNALDRGDKKEYKDLEAEEIASMVMTYSDAGQFDYLMNLIDEVYTVETPEQVLSIRQFMTFTEKQGDKDVVKSLLDGKTDQEVIDYYKEQKKKITDKAKKFHDIYNNVNEIYGNFGGGQVSDQYIKTLALDIMSIDDREDRIKQVSESLLESVKNYANQLRMSMPDKDFGDVDALLENLQSIHDLALAFGDDGVIQQIEQEQYKKLAEANDAYKEAMQKYRKFLESDRGAQYAIAEQLKRQADEQGQKLSKEESKALRNLRKSFNSRYKNKLKWENVIKDIHDSRKNQDMYKNFSDLERLLIEREMLYVKLGMLSGENGQDLFNGILSKDIFDMLKKYQKKSLENVYDEYKRTGELNTLGFGVDDLADIANEKGDVKESENLGQIGDYMRMFDDGSLSMENQYVNDVYQNIIGLLLNNKDKTKKEKDDIIKQYLYTDSGNANVNSVKNIIKGKISSEQTRKENEEEAKKAVQHEDGGKKQNDEIKTLKGFFKPSAEEFGKYLEQFDDVQSLVDDLKSKGIVTTKFFKGVYHDNNELLQYTIEELKGNFMADRSSFMEQNNFDDSDMAEQTDADRLQNENSQGQQKQQAAQAQPQNPQQSGQPEPSTDNDGVVQSGYGSTVEFATPQSHSKDTDVLGEITGVAGMNQYDAEKKSRKTNVDEEYVTSGNSQDMPDVNNGTDAFDVMRFGGSYDIGQLILNSERPYQQTEGDMKYLTVQSVYSKLITDAKCQEFLNDGLLAEVVNYFNSTNQPERAQVRFVYSGDDRYLGKDNAHYFTKTRIPLAAIQLSEDDIKNIINAEKDEVRRNLLRQKFSESSRLFQFNGKQGVMTFQILGPVTPQWFGSKDKSNSKEQYLTIDVGNEGKLKFNRYIDNDFENFMNKFSEEMDEHIKGDIMHLNGDESEKGNGGFWKYSSFMSPIEYIYTGRLIKSDVKTLRQLTDKEGLKLDELDGRFQIRVIYDYDNGKMLDYGKSLGGRIVPLNSNFINSFSVSNGRTRNGTVWILTKEADGNIYYKGATMGYFNRTWYSQNVGNKSNYYMQQILKNLMAVVDNSSDTRNIEIAFKNLHQLFYIDPGNKFFVDTKRQLFYIGSDRDGGINLKDGSRDDVVEKIIDYMFSKNGYGYRFSLSNPNIGLKQIVSSDIIITDLDRINNIGSSFAISKLVESSKGFITPKRSVVFDQIRRSGAAQTGFQGQQPGMNVNTIHIDNVDLTVRVTQDGKMEYFIDGKAIPKEDIQYYDSLYKTYQIALNPEKYGIKPVWNFNYEGRGRRVSKKPPLFVYAFSVGTTDKREFGIVISNKQDNIHYTLSQDQMKVLRKKEKGFSLTSQESDILDDICKKIGREPYKRTIGKNAGKSNESTENTGENVKQRPSQQEFESFFKDRYGDKTPKIGDKIQYTVIPVGENGVKDLSNTQSKSGVITGYANTKSIIVKPDDGTSQDSITLDEMDLFYGKSQQMPKNAIKYKQYRHITTIGKDNTMFDMQASFSDAGTINHTAEKTASEKPKTQESENVPAEKRSDGTVDFGQRRRPGRQNAGSGIKIPSLGITDPDNVINSENIILVRQKIEILAQPETRQQLVQMLDEYGITKQRFVEEILGKIQQSEITAKQGLVEYINKMSVNDSLENRRVLIEKLKNILECHTR